MTTTRCVLLSAAFDMHDYFGAVMAEHAPAVTLVGPDTAEPEAVTLALAWRPPGDGFTRFPALRAVCGIGAGIDNILSCPSLPAGLPVVRVLDPRQGAAMAEYVLFHVLWHHRRFGRFLEQQRQARWQRFVAPPAGEMTVGILGLGRIGGEVAGTLQGLGYQVAGWRRTDGPAGLDAVLARSDILVNLLPLTPETRGILDHRLFRRMKPGASLVQVGRGEHLVEADLLAALDSGRLSGAALDVFPDEPLAASHPFWHHPGIVVTPHVASEASPVEVARTLARTAAELAAGQPPSAAIDRRRGY